MKFFMISLEGLSDVSLSEIRILVDCQFFVHLILTKSFRRSKRSEFSWRKMKMRHCLDYPSADIEREGRSTIDNRAGALTK